MAVVNISDAELSMPDATGVRTLTLNRREKANTVSDSLVRRLHELLDTVGCETRLLVITGAGKNFCGGFDFAECEQLSEADLLMRFVLINELLARVRQAPYLTMAWVNGAAYGAGADLACACAYRYGNSRARFRFPGFQFGVALGTRRLRHLIGAEHALNVLSCNEEIDSQRAVELGLLTAVLGDEALPEFIAKLSSRVQGLDAYARSTVVRITDSADHDADLVDVVRSVARKGIHARISLYRQQDSNRRHAQ